MSTPVENAAVAAPAEAARSPADSPPLSRPLQAFVVLQVVVAAAVLGFAALRYSQHHAARQLPPVDPHRVPLAVAPLYDDPHVISDEDLRRVLGRLVPRYRGSKTRIGDVDHALRMWGPRVEFSEPDALSGRGLLDLLLDTRRFKQVYGADAPPLLIMDSQGGVSVRTREDALMTASHVDHTLACLAEAGIPLDYPVLASRPTTVRAILEQSLRDFRLNQPEYEWSALAYLLYLAPDTTGWFTTEGQQVDFNRLAERLMRQEVPQGSCAAHHRMHTLVMMLRVDAETPLFEPPTRRRVVEYLQGITRQLVEQQHADGYWHGAWNGLLRPGRDTQALDTTPNRLLVTGHVLEWWALAPEELLPPGREPIRRAGQWLTRTILEMNDEQIAAWYTYLSHAGRALALWRKRFPHEVPVEGMRLGDRIESQLNLEVWEPEPLPDEALEPAAQPAEAPAAQPAEAPATKTAAEDA